MDNTEESTQRPPATPTGELWDRFCRRDDPSAATRWFPGTEPPTTSKERSPYGVKTIVVDEENERSEASVYLYWPGRNASDADPHGEREEMVRPLRMDGERVLEELWRQHPEADPLEVDTLFNDIVETMLVNHLIRAAGELWRTRSETRKRYADIDYWSLKVEDSAGRRQAWRLAHG